MTDHCPLAPVSAFHLSMHHEGGLTWEKSQRCSFVMGKKVLGFPGLPTPDQQNWVYCRSKNAVWKGQQVETRLKTFVRDNDSVSVSSSGLHVAGIWRSCFAWVLLVKHPGGISCLLEKCLSAFAELGNLVGAGEPYAVASHPSDNLSAVAVLLVANLTSDLWKTTLPSIRLCGSIQDFTCLFLFIERENCCVSPQETSKTCRGSY